MSNKGLSSVIAEYIEQRRLDKTDPIKKALEKKIKKVDDEVEIAALKSKAAEDLQEINDAYVPANWLDMASKKVNGITLATHILKFTNGEAKGTNVFSAVYVDGEPYLTTACLPKLSIDSSSDAARIPIAKFLLLEFEGLSVYQAITQGLEEIFHPFSNDQEQIHRWMTGFSEVFNAPPLASHYTSKQIFFPVGDQQYHVLSPLFATSLVHELDRKISNVKFGKDAVEIRAARRKGEHHDSSDVRFVDMALLHFGGSKPQNISQLNSARGGKTYLLNCAPPVWRSPLTPPTKVTSIFKTREVNRRSWAAVKALSSYLFEIRKMDSTLPIRLHIIELVNDIIDSVFSYVSEIQALSNYAGWSQEKCALTFAEQLWLDVMCPLQSFQLVRSDNEWQESVCNAFGVWLNGKMNSALNKYGMDFSDVQQRHWEKLMKPLLRDYENETQLFAKTLTEGHA